MLSWLSSIICSPHYSETLISIALQISERLFQNSMNLNLSKFFGDFCAFSMSLIRHAIRHRKQEMGKLLLISLKMANVLSQNEIVVSLIIMIFI